MSRSPAAPSPDDLLPATASSPHEAADPLIARRRFLISGAALLGAGALGLPARADETPVATAPAAPAATAEGAPALLKAKSCIDALKGQLKGRLLLPGDEGFAMAAFPNNARWADVRPQAIAMCADPRDVELCVRCLHHDPKMPFAIRSGGHNYAGFSTTEGLLIDVKAMNRVSFDLKEGTATIAGGANNQNMADAMRYTRFAVPSGRCPSVGASGLVLGGGWGFSATHAGLTCDSLLSTDIVLASGERVTANADLGNPYSDLFWGLRGGGGGNFGVNTSFTFRLHEVGKVTIFNITWPAERQIEMLMLLQKIQLTNATTISTRSKIVPNRPGRHPQPNELMVTTLGQFFGNSDELRQVLEPAYSRLKPLHEDIRTLDYWQARDYLITDDPTGMYDIRSAYVHEVLDPKAIEVMIHHMTRWPGGSLLPENMGILFAIGGKVKEVKPHDTAYVHRHSNFIFEMERSWSPIDHPDVVDAQQRWLEHYWDDMQPFLQRQSYVNFPSRDLEHWQHAYYGSNLDRLKQLKLKYDRHNLFRFGQSIPLP